MTNSRPHKISGKTGDWEIVIGLEVHAQVSSKLKLFLMAVLVLEVMRMKT